MGNGVNDGGLSRFHILKEVENSLKRLKIGQIPIYLIHWHDLKVDIIESLNL